MSGSPLPEALAIPTEKLGEYLLNIHHPQGGPKARFFLLFGFTPDRTSEFAGALFRQAAEATLRKVTPGIEGRRIVACIGPIRTPSGRMPWVRTVWQVDLDEIGRLVTAHPDRERPA